MNPACPVLSMIAFAVALLSAASTTHAGVGEEIASDLIEVAAPLRVAWARGAVADVDAQRSRAPSS